MAKKLGKYKVLEEVGRGGMAVVYRAHQESLDRIVAIKELDLSRTSSDPKALERFQLEAKSAASLDHPSIVTVHDFWERSSKAYIAMEFVEGLEVKELLERMGPIPADLVAYIVLQVARALSFAHERGIVHRDIKPGNIMLSKRGQVKLADFGIALVSGAADLTTTGQIIGTPSYMSPEQIRGEEMGPASDIFSLGSVLYEMYTGVKPFTGPTDAAVIHAIIHRRPVSPRKLNRSVPRRLVRIMKKCLRKRATRRYATMAELVDALERAVGQRETQCEARLAELISRATLATAADATMPVTSQVSERESRSPWPFMGLAGAVLVVGIVLFWTGDTGVPPQGEGTVPPGGSAATVPVTIHAYPWAEVRVDGKTIGYTPSAAPFEIPVGRHRLELVHPQLGNREFLLSLNGGENRTIRVDFLEPK